jgi:hypothetical protein
MPIQFKCDVCRGDLTVDDSLGGKRGKCPHCNNRITVPNCGTLRAADAEEIIAELLRRGQSTIVLSFDTPVDGNYQLNQQNFSVKCDGSDDMTAEQVGIAIRSVAAMSESQAIDAPTGDGPYDLKGDPVGMTLEEFKRKYHRKVTGHDKPAPFTSEDNPGEKT